MIMINAGMRMGYSWLKIGRESQDDERNNIGIIIENWEVELWKMEVSWDVPKKNGDFMGFRGTSWD